MSTIQSGVVTVGSHSGSQVKTVTIAFPQTFPTTPTVVGNTVASTPYESAKDSFAVSVETVSTEQAVVHVYRVDSATSNGWGQNLRLGWIAYSS